MVPAGPFRQVSGEVTGSIASGREERQVVDMHRVESGKPSKEAPLWAYAYQLLPPRAADRMSGILELVEQENADALRNARAWTARVVSEPQVTHVLVLSDTPEVDRDRNRRLETRLRDLDVRFTVTFPMRVDEPAPDAETP
jgi:hypothetical protein